MVTGRVCLLAFASICLAACDGSFCEEFPEACGEPVGGNPAAGAAGPGAGGSGAAASDGGAGGGRPACDPPCVANDANTTAECVGGTCEYSCAAGFINCDEDPTTCEVASDEDGNCGACGVECAYDECALIDESYACNDPIDIDAGDDHTCAIKRDGSIWCWGLNSFGQLGSSTGINYSTLPSQIDTLPTTFRATHQSQGNNYGCAQSQDGAFACWPTIPNSTASAQVMSGTDLDLIGMFDLASRGDEALVIRENDQSARRFFYDYSSSQIDLELVTAGAIEVLATSGDHRCVIFADQALKCWGDDDFGQIGNGGSTSTPVSIPFEVMPGTDFVAVGTGDKHTCALAFGGTIYCMGRNTSGYLASTDFPTDSPIPMLVQPPFSALFVGKRTNAAFSDDKLYLFGDNDANQVKPTSGDTSAPVLYTLPVGDVPVDVGLGQSHTCVLLETGLVKCWGANGTGQLGNGGTSPSSTPQTTLL